MLVFANVLQPLIDLADSILLFFHDSLAFGWGMSIVAMTIVVRLAMVPLTIKQIKSMNALRELQPQLKEIQEKYKTDRQRMNQEMMRFYRENKVNPFASCLPLLLQLPVFLALFYLLNGDEFKSRLTPESQGWLFIDNLAEKATGLDLVILIVLYVGSQIGASLVMSVTADKTQQRIMLLLPIAFAAIIPSFPAGLIVYWITTNFWTFGQQIVVRKLSPPRVVTPAAAGAPASAAVGAGGGKDNGAGKRPRGKAPPEQVTVPAKKPPPPPRKKKRRRR
jgi:YidC/Oxa1 family membrane protein insertase